MIGPVKLIAYTENIAETVDVFRINHHLYADDTQLQVHMRIDTIQANRLNLELCIDAIKDWCASRRLQLNGYKTEIIWFDSRANLKKLFSVDTTLRIGSTIVEPVNSVRNMGVYMDSALSMRTHIGKVSAACFYHLRRLRQLRYVMSKSTMQRIVSSLVLARIDYCNSILARLTAVTLAPLNRVMNAAARLVAGLDVRDHVTLVMRELHLLPVTFRVQYKLCLMVHSSVNGCSPEYITAVLVPMSSLQGRATLRSSTSGSFDVPRTRTCFGERAFSVAGPAAWNKLPPNLRPSIDNYRFKRALKAQFSVSLIAINLETFHAKRHRTNVLGLCMGRSKSYIAIAIAIGRECAGVERSWFVG